MRRRRTDTQQLVIPRGMLGPEEVAVIEIPKRFHKTPVVVLKRRPGELARIRASHYFVEAPYDLDPAMKNTRFMNPDVSGQTGQNMTMHPQTFAQNPSSFSNMSSGSHRVAHKNVTMALPPDFVQEPSRFSNVSSASTAVPQQFMGVPVVQPTFQPQVVYPQPMMSPQRSFNYSSGPDYSISGASCMSSKSGCGGGLSGSECPGQVDLVQKEKAEKEMLTRSLDEFQMARRKFLGKAKVLTAKISKMSIDSNDS
ncbi:uncharacterized protein [Tenebrio molitor]|uniref:uncharacterized protein isoform X4 n=1 Tax=Tenebrio molitor TaxID=7067 RepID=UPI0036246D0E